MGRSRIRDECIDPNSPGGKHKLKQQLNRISQRKCQEKKKQEQNELQKIYEENNKEIENLVNEINLCTERGQENARLSLKKSYLFDNDTISKLESIYYDVEKLLRDDLVVIWEQSEIGCEPVSSKKKRVKKNVQ